MPQLKKSAASAPEVGQRAGTAAKLRGHAPTKTYINLAEIGIKRTRWWAILVTVLVIVQILAAIGKFLVYDKMSEVSDAEAKAAAVQRDLAECNARIESYGELNEKYAHYTWSTMTKEETGRVDRVEIMDMLERMLTPIVDVPSWTLKGNQLSLSVVGKTLQDVNKAVQKLQEDPMVGYCEVNTAQSASDSVRLPGTTPESVNANILLYLNNPEGGAAK